MSEIVFSVQVIPDSFEEFQIDSGAPTGNFLKRIAEELHRKTGKKVDLSEYKVLVAYQLLNSSVQAGQLISQGNVDVAGDPSFAEIGMRSGYHILLVKPPTVTSNLKLEFSGQKRIVNKNNFTVGRVDANRKINPDLDLTPYLGNYAQKVSRQLLSFVEEQGKWSLQLNEKARSAVFLDNVRLNHSTIYELPQQSLVSIGNSPEHAYQKITVTIINN